MFWKLKMWILVNFHILFCEDDSFDDFCRYHGIKLTMTTWSGYSQSFGK